MIHIGKRQFLKVYSEDRSGYYLLCRDNNEVFMPGTLAGVPLKTGSMVEVFVFIDSKGDPIATSQMPIAQVGEFACLTVKEVNHHGAFLDLGLPKDLLVPNKLQKYPMKSGEVHLVRVLLDEETTRLYGTEKIGPYIENKNIPLVYGQPINIVPFHQTELGYKSLIEQKYLGMVFHNEIFSKVELGKEYQGSVKTVRPDGQVDALLKQAGLAGIEDATELILAALEAGGGTLQLCDKSPPETIKKQLGISKKAFKAAVGMLYKKRQIDIKEGYIELNPDLFKK